MCASQLVKPVHVNVVLIVHKWDVYSCDMCLTVIKTSSCRCILMLHINWSFTEQNRTEHTFI